MTLNTFIAGEPGAGQVMADYVTKRARAVEDKATGWHNARAKAEGEWEGSASEAFVTNRAQPNGRDADALAQINHALAAPFTAWGDGIRAAEQWMERAKKVARDGQLSVWPDRIFPPKAFAHLSPEPPTGRITATDSSAHAQANAEFEAAKALHAKQQAAFDEAKALVQQARDLERKTHDELRQALTKETNALKQLGQFQTWSQAAKSATTPAATSLMGLATDLENRSLHGSRTVFEKAVTQGPAATNSMWNALTSEQRADLISRHPQMVGSADGIPAATRDIANRRTLDAQRQALVNRIEQAKRAHEKETQSEFPAVKPGVVDGLKDSLEELDKLKAKLGDNASDSGYYLLGLDSTADDRGRVIVAHNNPDTADNVSTLVPGTYSDLSKTSEYINNNDQVLQRANELTPQGTQNSMITWIDYESPPELLPDASRSSYKDNGHASLSDFQEGLRTTHQGDTPSHNTLVGHSYGTPVIGDASTNGGTHADDLVFLGSPGVGVDHANQLDVPKEHVWAGTSRDDEIHNAVSGDPRDWNKAPDQHWFGLSPADPRFGGNVIPANPSTPHSGYWEDPATKEVLAQVTIGKDK